METPSSIRRVTRSQSKSSINSIPKWKCDESEKIIVSGQKNTKLDRSALIDITNDSPIVGLAAGSVETPSSYAKKLGQQQQQLKQQTPGTGEALLRYQVKNLLQKVEEEADHLSKIPLEHHRRFLQLCSPSALLAPTPANTPQVLNLSGNGDMSIKFDVSASEIPFAVEEEEEPKNQQEDMVTRSLLLDFSEKSEMTDSSSSPCSSVLTYQGGIICQEKSTEDDDASVWSMQVNASSTQDEDEEGEIEYVEEDYDEDEEQEEEEAYEDCEEEGGLLDELCDGLSKISVQEKKMPEFEGKHTRFVYNSDDEIEGEEDVGAAASSSVLCLKGLPVPEGKHLRFADEDEE